MISSELYSAIDKKAKVFCRNLGYYSNFGESNVGWACDCKRINPNADFSLEYENAVRVDKKIIVVFSIKQNLEV